MRGINTKAQLAETEAVLQQRLAQGCARCRRHDDRARDRVSVGGHQVRRAMSRSSPMSCSVRASTIDANAVIHSFSHLTGAHVGEGASIGPYARLRPGSENRQGRARVGNFVEVKEAVAGRRRQGQSSRLYRRRRGSARAPISAPAPSSATMTARPSTAPISARAPSSARIPRWWLRSPSATGPISARAL